MIFGLGLLTACQRPVVLGGADGEVPGGARVHVLRVAAPPEAYGRFTRWGGASEMTAGVRRWWDPVTRVCGGYELRVKPLGNGQFEVRIGALGGSMDGFHRVDLPHPIAPQVLRAREPLEVELRYSGGARLYDRIEVLRESP